MNNEMPIITKNQKEVKMMIKYIEPLQKMLLERRKDLHNKGQKTIYINPKFKIVKGE